MFSFRLVSAVLFHLFVLELDLNIIQEIDGIFLCETFAEVLRQSAPLIWIELVASQKYELGSPLYLLSLGRNTQFSMISLGEP